MKSFRYNIFIYDITTQPMPWLAVEEADNIVKKMADDISYAFDIKYNPGYWGMESALNVIAGGASFFYIVVPKKESVKETQDYIESTFQLIMMDMFKVHSSEAKFFRTVKTLDEGKEIVDSIIDVLFDGENQLH